MPTAGRGSMCSWGGVGRAWVLPLPSGAGAMSLRRAQRPACKQAAARGRRSGRCESISWALSVLLGSFGSHLAGKLGRAPLAGALARGPQLASEPGSRVRRQHCSCGRVQRKGEGLEGAGVVDRALTLLGRWLPSSQPVAQQRRLLQGALPKKAAVQSVGAGTGCRPRRAESLSGLRPNAPTPHTTVVSRLTVEPNHTPASGQACRS